MLIVTLDLEGVLVPEIWIEFAKVTKIDELKLTTKDIKDYDALMKHRLKILQEHKLTLSDIQETISKISPYDGAFEFVSWLRERCQLVILSDTFEEFSKPLMRQLNMPTIFCHQLTVNKETNIIDDYNLRMSDHKTNAVRAFQGLNYKVFAAGDSYNDTGMLLQANDAALFKAPQNVIEEFPQLKSLTKYDELKGLIEAML